LNAISYFSILFVLEISMFQKDFLPGFRVMAALLCSSFICTEGLMADEHATAAKASAPAETLGPRLTPSPEASGKRPVPFPSRKTDKKSLLPNLKPEDAFITINGEVLTWGAMLRHAELLISQIRPPKGVTMQDFEEDREELLMRRIYRLAENHITKTLLAQEARRHNIRLTEQEVKAKEDEIFADVRKKSKKPDTYLREFRTPGSYFSFDLTNTVLLARLKKDVIRPSIVVTDKDIEEEKVARVEENKKLVAKNAELRPKIEDILKQLRAGADFGDLAFRLSDCDSSYDRGAWGTFKREDLRPELATVAFAMKEGTLSDVIETPYSYHILKLEKKNLGFQAEGSKQPPPVVSVKLSQIMLEKKELLPELTAETARQQVLDKRVAEKIEALRTKLIPEAKIQTPLALF